MWISKGGCNECLESRVEGAKIRLQHLIDESLAQGLKAIVAFSGGKESIVLADLLKDRKDNLTLVWVNPQAMFPHMIEFVRGYRDKGFTLVELLSDQPTRLLNDGLPTSVVPVNFLFKREGQPLKITDYFSCCHQLRFNPLAEYVISQGCIFVIGGQRRADEVLNFHGETSKSNFRGNQFEIVSPLWEWTTDEVMEYIHEHQLELPKQYPAVMDSLECWSCTHNPTKERIDFMRSEYPELLAELKPLLAYVYTNTINELDSQLKGAAYANTSQL